MTPARAHRLTHMTAYLNKREQRQLQNAMRYAPEKIKGELVGRNHGKFQERFAESFDAEKGCAKCGTLAVDYSVRLEACKTYGAFAGMLGSQSQIILNLNASLGVRDEAELRELVESGRALKRSEQDVSKTVGDIADETIQLLADCIRRDPTIAARARAAIDAVAPQGRTAAMDEPSMNGDKA